jgi:outer membrane protein assembly factor BamA
MAQFPTLNSHPSRRPEISSFHLHGGSCKAFLVIVSVSFLVLSCKPRTSQGPASPTIATAVTVSEIFVAGNRELSTETIRSQIRTQIGGLLDESTVRNDVARIRALGGIRDVRVSYETARDGGRVVTFNIAEILPK